MIKKQNLWFLTLFSLVLVLSVYYITMPNELFLMSDVNKDKKNVDEKVSAEIKESELLVTMRVELEEEREKVVADLKNTLTNADATSEEKNNAYEQIKYITNLSVQEESLQAKIKQKFGIDSFVKLSNNLVKIVAIKEKHDTKLANDIMKAIQEEFSDKMSISITFEK